MLSAQSGTPHLAQLLQDVIWLQKLMNVLFEPFHRWAAAQAKGVVDTFTASASFADNATLVATPLEEVAFLVEGYRQSRGLLGGQAELTQDTSVAQ